MSLLERSIKAESSENSIKGHVIYRIHNICVSGSISISSKYQNFISLDMSLSHSQVQQITKSGRGFLSESRI